MVMRADPDALIEALSGERDRREAAIARLIIMGPRAVPRLIAACGETTDREQRVAMLRVLEAIGDARSLKVARQAVAEGGDVAVAGVAVLRELLARDAGPAHADALDSLLALAREPSSERRVRAAAIRALDSAPEDVRHAVQMLGQIESADDALWHDATAGRLPDDPQGLREALATRGATAPLAELRRLIESVAERERASDKASSRAEWQAVRGALHQALALRDSRVALYDLRETVEAAAAPLPPSFLAAIQVIGDASCLEPLAVAFARGSEEEPRWRHLVAQAFHEIVRRERLTKRHAAMRRALARAPALHR